MKQRILILATAFLVIIASSCKKESGAELENSSIKDQKITKTQLKMKIFSEYEELIFEETVLTDFEIYNQNNYISIDFNDLKINNYAIQNRINFRYIDNNFVLNETSRITLAGVDFDGRHETGYPRNMADYDNYVNQSKHIDGGYRINYQNKRYFITRANCDNVGVYTQQKISEYISRISNYYRNDKENLTVKFELDILDADFEASK